MTIHAIYENGVFRPVEQVSLPDKTLVELQVSRLEGVASMPGALAKVYEILGERFESGHKDTAARHNEHQP